MINVYDLIIIFFSNLNYQLIRVRAVVHSTYTHGVNEQQYKCLQYDGIVIGIFKPNTYYD